MHEIDINRYYTPIDTIILFYHDCNQQMFNELCVYGVRTMLCLTLVAQTSNALMKYYIKEVTCYFKAVSNRVVAEL